jgi:hypothetical protein
MVPKNQKLFVTRLSNFWLGEMLLGHKEKENVSRQNKKMEGTNGLDPLPQTSELLLVLVVFWRRM